MEAEPESETEPKAEPSGYGGTSPWPVVVAAGFVLSEVGILFNLYPLSVAGLVVFVGSVSGIVHETGYVRNPYRLAASLGAVLVVVGLLVVSTQVDGGVAAYVAAADIENGIVQRGYTVAATGLVVTLAGVALPRIVNQ